MAKQWDLAVPVEVLFPEILENGDVVFSSARVSTAEEGHPVGNEVENAHAVPAHVQSIHQSTLSFHHALRLPLLSIETKQETLFTPSSLWSVEEEKERWSSYQLLVVLSRQLITKGRFLQLLWSLA